MTPPGLSVADLLGSYAQIPAELRERGVVRSNNAPVGDYAESLVSEALGGKFADYVSEKSYDLIAPQWGKVQVKARAVGDPPRGADLQTSPFRSWDFDYAALVMVQRSDYRVNAAYMVPVDVLQPFGTWRSHVNGSTIRMTPELFAQDGVVEITEVLQQAADSM